jgi:hypothetical protein
MNVEIGTKATQFPDKEYIKGIFVAMQCPPFSEFSDAKSTYNHNKAKLTPPSPPPQNPNH